MDPRGYINIAWLSMQDLIFLYNAWVIPLRAVFPFARTSHHPYLWLFCDYLGDLQCDELLKLTTNKEELLKIFQGSDVFEEFTD